MSVTRAAGLNERRCIIRDALGLYGSIVTLATYSTAAPFDDHLKADITRAVKKCISVHAVLATVVQDAETEHPSLAKVSDIDLDSHIQWRSGTDSTGDLSASLDALLEEIHNEPWSTPETRPQWRLHLTQLPASKDSHRTRLHAALATSHSLADGMSGLAFHTTFLQALSKPSSITLFDANPTIHLDPAQYPLLPPLDLAGHFPISWSFLLGPLIGHFLPGPIARLLGIKAQEQHVWYGAQTRPQLRPQASSPLLPTEVHTTLVPAETLRGVLQACRRHDARLTGLLNVLTARALAATLQAERGAAQQQQTFAIETAIDLRRCLPVAKARMANYTSGATDTVTIGNAGTKPATVAGPAGTGGPTVRESDGVHAEDWDAARRITAHLAGASSTLVDQPVALLKYLGNYREWTLGKATAAATASFSTSNLGGAVAVAAAETETDNGTATAITTATAASMDTDEPRDASTIAGRQDSGARAAAAEPWRRELMLFSQSADGTGAPFNMNVASCADGALAVVMSWWPGMLGVAEEKAFMADVCRKLMLLLKSLSAA